MCVNEALWDRLLRLALGIGLFVLAASPIDWSWVFMAGLAGLVLVMTGFLGWCPLYHALGITSLRVSQRS